MLYLCIQNNRKVNDADKERQMNTTDTLPTWVVIRTFNRKEMEISSFLRQNDLRHFIPMTYRERLKAPNEKPQKELVPVIHNYVFLEKSLDEPELSSKLAECRVPLQLMKQKGSDRISEIPDREMVEFRLLCDPDYSKTPAEFLEAEEGDALPGKEVVVVHGQFAGLHGKLHKKNQKYWFVKTVGGISVMLRISRWYCKVVENKLD